jgi:hypothetical protein
MQSSAQACALTKHSIRQNRTSADGADYAQIASFGRLGRGPAEGRFADQIGRARSALSGNYST